MIKNNLIQINEALDIKEDINKYTIVDNYFIINDKYSLKYNLNSEMTLFNKSQDYLKKLNKKLNKLYSDKKMFTYIFMTILILILGIVFISYLLSSMPFITIGVLAIFDFTILTNLIKTTKKYKNTKSEYNKLKDVLTYKKIDIDSKLYEMQNQSKKIIEIPMEKLEVLDLENYSLEQLKQLSLAGCGKESEIQKIDKEQKLIKTL